VNLRGANFNEANLIGVNLSATTLNGETLSRRNISDAKLSQVDLSEADLSESDFSNANLYEANLYKANLDLAAVTAAAHELVNRIATKSIQLLQCRAGFRDAFGRGGPDEAPTGGVRKLGSPPADESSVAPTKNDFRLVLETLRKIHAGRPPDRRPP
jgi:Pentapeptide repeats (8 copies)